MATPPWGCHRRRIPDRIVFDKLIQVVRFGCSYEAIADTTCSAATLRARRDEWIRLGLFAQLATIARDCYDRIVGLALTDIAVDGCITKAPGGGEYAGPSPVDRRKQGLKRSVLVEGEGVPLGRVLAGAQRHDDSPLPAPTRATCRTSMWCATPAGCSPSPSRNARSGSVPGWRPWVRTPSPAACWRASPLTPRSTRGPGRWRVLLPPHPALPDVDDHPSGRQRLSRRPPDNGVDRPSLVHDMRLTEHYLVLVVAPCSSTSARPSPAARCSPGSRTGAPGSR